MQFVEDHTLERAEHIGRIGAGEQQRQLLRRGEQNIGRVTPLSLALGSRRVASAGFNPHWQSHLLNRNLEVPRNVDGERLQRRNIKSMQPLRAHQGPTGRLQVTRADAALAQLHERRQKAGQGLAAAGRCDQQRRMSRAGFPQKRKLMLAYLPTAASKPAEEDIRQLRRVAEEVSRGFHGIQYPATTINPGTGTPFSMRGDAKSRLTGFRPDAIKAARTCASL